MKYILTLVATFATFMPLMAQSTYSEVVKTIIDNNAQLRRQVQEVSAQALDDTDANALANPSVDFSRVWGRHGIGNKLQLDISQEFEWPGVYSARSEAAQARRNASLMQCEAERLDMVMSIKTLLNELIYVRHQIEVIDDLRSSFNKLDSAIERGVRGGELTIIDQRKMQIESFEIDNDLTAAKGREQQIIAQLQGMTQMPLDLSAINTYPLQPIADLDTYLAQIGSDPAIVSLGLAADEAEASARVASNSRMPGFSVGYQHQAEMGDRFNGFTVGVDLPFFKGRKAKQAAIERRDAADLSRQAAINKRSAEINGLYAELKLQKERIDKYTSIFGDRQYLNLLLKAYEGGQLSVIEYLSEVHYYHQTMLIYLDSEYNYHNALTNLNRLN